ncbi:MAG: ferritin family protein [Thiogranum sp.]
MYAKLLTSDVQTASELMSIALYAEHEAIRRYARLAEAMHGYGNRETASLFERLAREEREHERLIREWAQLENIELRTDIGPVKWEDPQVATDYDSEAVDPAHSTPYRALAFAVHNEERAFHFYAQVAATAEDETVREYAETLAREELGHAALLRAMRRRAWRAERETGHEEPHIDPAAIHTLADLLAVAASAERCLADNIAALADSHPELAKVGKAASAVLAGIEAQRVSAGQPGGDAVRAIESIASYKRAAAAKNDDPDTMLQRLRSDSDRCFAFYDTVVTHAGDEAVMLAAQKLSESVLERIDLLRDVARS